MLHKGVAAAAASTSDLQPLSGLQGPKSARLNGLRAKGWQPSPIAPLMNDIPISCTKCGAKYSVPPEPILADLASASTRRRTLPTR
jgi:hypothetical protein